jgi:hypothetical protein
VSKTNSHSNGEDHEQHDDGQSVDLRNVRFFRRAKRIANDDQKEAQGEHVIAPKNEDNTLLNSSATDSKVVLSAITRQSRKLVWQESKIRESRARRDERVFFAGNDCSEREVVSIK